VAAADRDGAPGAPYGLGIILVMENRRPGCASPGGAGVPARRPMRHQAAQNPALPVVTGTDLQVIYDWQCNPPAPGSPRFLGAARLAVSGFSRQVL
jgi:hypothetical protein